MSDEPGYRKALRKAFPGVWIREDGAFRCEGSFELHWEPGDVESDLMMERGSFAMPGLDGRLTITSRYNDIRPRLKLSQLQAITAYIENVTDEIAARAKGEASTDLLRTDGVDAPKPSPEQNQSPAGGVQLIGNADTQPQDNPALAPFFTVAISSDDAETVQYMFEDKAEATDFFDEHVAREDDYHIRLYDKRTLIGEVDKRIALAAAVSPEQNQSPDQTFGQLQGDDDGFKSWKHDATIDTLGPDDVGRFCEVRYGNGVTASDFSETFIWGGIKLSPDSEIIAYRDLGDEQFPAPIPASQRKEDGAAGDMQLTGSADTCIGVKPEPIDDTLQYDHELATGATGGPAPTVEHETPIPDAGIHATLSDLDTRTEPPATPVAADGLGARVVEEA